MAEQENPRSSSQQNNEQDMQKTYQQLQQMNRTWKSTDGSDRVAAIAKEYVDDSSVKQAEEVQVIQKADQKISMASLLSADYQTITNTEVFDRMSDADQAILVQEYYQETRNFLESEIGPYKSAGLTEEDVFRQGFVIYEKTLSTEEASQIQAWLDAEQNGTLSSDQSLKNLISDLNTQYHLQLDETNSAIVRAQLQNYLSQNKVPRRVECSQEALNAAQLLAEDRHTYSAETKSLMVETVRSKHLSELKANNASVRKFMEEHPNATMADFKKAMEASREALARNKREEKEEEENQGRNSSNDTSAQNPRDIDIEDDSDNIPSSDDSGTIEVDYLSDSAKAIETKDTTQRTSFYAGDDIRIAREQHIPLKEKMLDPTAVFDEEGLEELSKIFENYGELTQSTGMFRQDAAIRALSFLTGDLAPAINLLSMGGKAGKKVYDISYNRWLEKSKDASTQAYRESMKKAKDRTKSSSAAERYYGKQDVRELRAQKRFEKRQTKKYGTDRSKWGSQTPPTKPRTKFDDTIKGKLLGKLNNSKLGKALGKFFGLKAKFQQWAMKMGASLLKAGAIAYFKFAVATIAIGVIAVAIIPLVIAIAGIFSSVMPEYAQNAINNLNTLDKMYVFSVKNEIVNYYCDHDEETGDPIYDKAKYESHKWDVHLDLEDAKVYFIDENSHDIPNGNNVLPIMAAFKYRTGAEIDHGSYVAASAYAKVMYWKTHTVEIEEGVPDYEAHLDFVEDCGCRSYKHEPTLDSKPRDRKNICDDYEYEVTSKLKCTLAHHPQHTSSCYRSYPRYRNGRIVGYSSRLVCTKPLHSHKAFPVTETEDSITTPCYHVRITCNGHCPSHVTPQRTVKCYMDVLNIVKRDNLIFTKESLTYGEDVLQWTGTLEQNFDEWVDTCLGPWWNRITHPNATYDFSRLDFYNEYIANTHYGTGKNEAKLYKNYGDNSTKAIFYSGASLYTSLVNDFKLRNSLGATYKPLTQLTGALAGPNREFVDSLVANFTFITSGTTLDRLNEATNLSQVDPNNLDGLLRYKTRVDGIDFDLYDKLLDHYKVQTHYLEGNALATDYLSPFIWDVFTMDGETPTFRNGWGFYDREQPYADSYAWEWAIDPKQLTYAVGTYHDGYQAAIDYFHDEMGLYFNNGAISEKVLETNSTRLISAVDAIEETAGRLGSGRSYSPTDVFNIFLQSITNNAAYHIYYGSMQGKNGDNLTIGENMLLAKNHLATHEKYENVATWETNYENYTYIYVICEVNSSDTNIGNWGAGEKYYYCVVYSPPAYGDFSNDHLLRITMISEEELNLCDRSVVVN